MTFDATVNPVVYEGGEPIFIDTEYDTWNIGEKTLVLITGIIAIAGNAIQIYCDYIANIDFTGFGTIKNYNHVMLGVFIFMLLKLVFEGIDLTGIGKLLNLSDEYSFEMYLVHQLLILGPFSLLALTGNVMVNILIMLFSICTLTLLLKKAEKAVNRMAPWVSDSSPSK